MELLNRWENRLPSSA